MERDRCGNCGNLVRIRATRIDPPDAYCRYDKDDDDGLCEDFCTISDYPDGPDYDECEGK